MPQYPYFPTNINLGALATLTAASANGTTALQTNVGARGLTVNINVTAITGTSPTLTVTIQGVDPVSTETWTILASTAISADGFHQLQVYPGIGASANASANALIPVNWQIAYAIGGTTPAVTATISASYQV